MRFTMLNEFMFFFKMLFRLLSQYINFCKLSKIGLLTLSSAATLTTVESSLNVEDDVKKLKKNNDGVMQHARIDQYPNLTIGHCNSMSNCLTPTLYARMCERVSQFGFTLDDAIQPGVDDPCKPSDTHSGLVAGDEESYKLFNELFECVIEDKFGKNVLSHQHPVETDLSSLKLDDHVVNAIAKIRLRVCRNLSRHPFPCWITRAGRRLIEQTMINTIDKLAVNKITSLFKKSTKLKASYYSLVDLPDSYKVNPSYTPYWRSTNVNRDWPDARGAFVISSRDATSCPTIISINDRDHLRVWTEIEQNSQNKMTLRKASSSLIQNMQQFFDHLILIEDMLLSDYGHGFAWDDKFGYLTSNPSECGTALKVEVEIVVPNLCTDKRLATIIKSKSDGNLRIVDVKENILKLTNHKCVGISEFELIQNTMNYLKLLVELDNELSENNSDIPEDNK